MTDPPLPSDRINPFYQGARFLTAAARLEQAPPDRGWEVAFAGRSNAGKSSAINAICHQKSLAKTSKTPGRTQQLIFFRLDDERRLVDLPGYGYAQVPLAVKRAWQAELARYLQGRRSLQGLVLVMDIRHPLTDYDRQMIAWGQHVRLPILALLTKADKLNRGAVKSACFAVERSLGQGSGDMRVLPFSATERLNVAAVQEILDAWLGIERPNGA